MENIDIEYIRQDKNVFDKHSMIRNRLFWQLHILKIQNDTNIVSVLVTFFFLDKRRLNEVRKFSISCRTVVDNGIETFAIY